MNYRLKSLRPGWKVCHLIIIQLYSEFKGFDKLIKISDWTKKHCFDRRWEKSMILRIMHELPWIRFLGNEWGDLPIIFTSDEVTSENYWQIASRVTQKLLFTITNVLFYLLHVIWCPWTQNSAKKQFSVADFATVAKDRPFWFSIVMSLQLICDVTRMQVTGIVTSYSSIVLARANWRKGDFH